MFHLRTGTRLNRPKRSSIGELVSAFLPLGLSLTGKNSSVSLLASDELAETGVTDAVETGEADAQAADTVVTTAARSQKWTPTFRGCPSALELLKLSPGSAARHLL